MHCLRFERLDAGDARAIARLERSEPRSDPAPSRQALARELADAERAGSNVSLGLYDGTRLVGCALAFAMPSGLRGQPGQTLRLSDLALHKGYESHLPEFLARWCDLATRRCPHAPLEIQCSEPETQRWRTQREPLLTDLGYRPAGFERVEDQPPGTARFWSRFEPMPPPSDDPRALPLTLSCQVAGDTYDVRTIRCETHWSRLEPFWDALVRATPGATRLQSFEYQRAWWRCFGQPHRLWIQTIWRGGALRGIAPLLVEAEVGPLGWCRTLGLIGTRWEVDRPTFLFGDDRGACHEVLQRCLAQADAPWDRLYLYEQEPDSTAMQALSAFAEREGCLVRVSPDSVCPYLDVTQPFESYFASRSRHFRKRVRAAHRKLEDQGALRAERVCDWPQVREALARYRELDRKSWKNERGVGLSDPRRSRFFDTLLDTLGPKGQLHVLELTLNEQLIAATIAFAHERHYYSLQIAHDAAFAEFSPGTVLEYLELQECHAGVYAEYDFLGGFLNNKLRWTSSVRETQQLHLARPSPRARLRHFWSTRLAPPVRGALNRMGLLKRGMALHGKLLDRLGRALGGDP